MHESFISGWVARSRDVRVVERPRQSGNERVYLFYGFGDAWFGQYAAAFSSQGLAWLEPLAGDSVAAQVERDIRARWLPVSLRRHDAQVQERLAQLVTIPGAPLAVHLCGTGFQLQVWRELLAIHAGSTISYGELARRIGRPQAARAVGAAAGANRIALLVPCHRVLPASGESGGFRWGVELKRRLLQAESELAKRAA